MTDAKIERGDGYAGDTGELFRFTLGGAEYIVGPLGRVERIKRETARMIETESTSGEPLAPAYVRLAAQVSAQAAEIERLRAEIARYTEEYGALRPPYDRDFGDDLLCECGHQYYRHFDGYDGNAPVGCKYCDCAQFKLTALAALEPKP